MKNPRQRVGIFLFVAVGAAIGIGPRVALGAENRITVGYGEGSPGNRGIVVPVTARHDLPIHGYSIAITYPKEVLTLRQINSNGTASAEVGVDFFNDRLYPDVGAGVAGVILDLSDPFQPTEIPSTVGLNRGQIIAWLIFDVRGDGPAGDFPIRLHDGVGDPPVSNRFTHRGTTIRPELQHGVFSVFSEDVMTVDSKFAFPGARINSLLVYARHSRPLLGYQVALSFDPRAVELTDATLTGTSVPPALGGFGNIEFVEIDWKVEDQIEVSPTEYRMRAGVVFDYAEPYNDSQVLPAEVGSTTKQSIMKFAFNVQDAADQFGESTALLLSDPPAVGRQTSNVFILPNLTSFVPRRVNGSIYFSTGFLTGKVIDYKTGLPIQGASVATEPGTVPAVTAADGTFKLGGQDGMPPVVYSISIKKIGYFPGRATANAPGKGGTAEIAAIALFPVPRGENEFHRGDANGDDRLDISDGIMLLGYLFLGGTPPDCDDAADSDNNGRLDVSDPINLFNYLFVGGRPPAAPFAACGPDPETDELDCKLFSGC